MCGLGYNYKLKANKFSCFLPTVNFLSMPAHNVLFQDIVKDKTRLGQINIYRTPRETNSRLFGLKCYLE